MKISGTPDNSGLARVVHSRVSADARMISARAAFLTLGGIGVAGLCIGAGAALAILAYARLNDRSFAASQIADAIATGLREAKLTVAVDPASTVKLDRDAEVKLSAGGEVTAKGTVGLDPNARVAVAGQTPDGARPTQAQLAMGAAPQSKRAVTTNYTIFKVVSWNKGEVVTGYKFTPDSDVPRSQYCYYSEQMAGEGASIRIDIGQDGRFVPSKAYQGLDATAAATNCVWYDGRSTAF